MNHAANLDIQYSRSKESVKRKKYVSLKCLFKMIGEGCWKTCKGYDEQKQWTKYAKIVEIIMTVLVAKASTIYRNIQFEKYSQTIFPRTLAYCARKIVPIKRATPSTLFSP